MEPIAFSGQLTEKDYRRISALALRKLKIVALIVLIVFSGYAVLGSYDSPGLWLSWGLPMLFVTAFWVFFLRYSVRKQWRKNKLLQKPISGFVSADGVAWNVEGITSAQIPWNMCLHYREQPSLILIYTGVNQALYFLPTFFAKDRDWEALRKVLNSKLPRK